VYVSIFIIDQISNKRKRRYEGEKKGEWVASNSICSIYHFIGRYALFIRRPTSFQQGRRHSSRVRAFTLVPTHLGTSFSIRRRDASWHRRRLGTTNGHRAKKGSSGPLRFSRWSHSFIRGIGNAGGKPRPWKQPRPRGFAKVKVETGQGRTLSRLESVFTPYFYSPVI
jgi:hypothetical protein